ncbi:MAG TPA: glycosyltransferase family 4 protein [bacterium]|nr:glycosyltransferase family 4 protein [bacterium]
MKILQAHNYYQFSGGEDVVLSAEHQLLSEKNHFVKQLLVNNNEIKNYSLIQKLKIVFSPSDSSIFQGKIKYILNSTNFDILHCHNFYPLLSPGLFYYSKSTTTANLLTLHNFRLLCANASLFRNNNICEECINKSLYCSLKYKCYRNSRIATFAVARMVETHKKMRTWQHEIDAYICLTEFSRRKFRQGGLPNDKLFIKPNFLEFDPGFEITTGKYFLFIGRLETVKGVQLLPEVAGQVSRPINVIGQGTLLQSFRNVNNLKYLGQQKRSNVMKHLHNAICLILPSLWYEMMPMTILEAFACAKPVIASRLGAMAELIQDGVTGLLFEPGSAEDLAKKMNWAIEHPEEMKQMGLNARREYERKYTAETNYKILIEIYQAAIENKKKRLRDARA